MLGVVRRSIRNLIRSPLRTLLIVAILAVSTGLALIMLTVNGTAANQLESIGAEIGTEITVRPAGHFGMMGGGEPLNEEDVDKLEVIPHVVSVQKTIQTQYTGDGLQSAIELGTLGSRWQQLPAELLERVKSRFSSINVMGFDPAIEDPALMGGGQLKITGGRYFTIEESDANVVVVGQALADKNELDIGSAIDINGTSVQVIGIFTSGQRFGDNILVMPIDTVQRVFDLEGVTSVTVVADDVGNVDGVVDAIRGIFDEETADIVSTKDMYERINEPVVNAGKTSQIGMIAAFAVAAVIILFSVVLMVRQRVKEIGILKAIGASNWHIGFQFSVETLFISLPAAIIGALITFALAQRVADLLVPSALGLGLARAGGLFGGGVTRFAGIDVAVSPEIFLYALGIAVALAIAASIFPSWYVARVKPAEVLRYE